MTHVYVSVRFFGTVVDERLLPICDVMRIGESEGAIIPFPGADLVMRRVEGHLLVRGRQLGPGDTLSMSLGSVEVTLEVLGLRNHDTVSGLWDRLEDTLSFPIPDLRLLLATATIALAGSFLEVANGFVATNPVASRSVQAWLHQLAPEEETPQNARIQPPPGDGVWPTAVFITAE
ncbi:MAG: hypothetical protein JRJ84_07500 [Deltaproteobacteria bacterium]|nr:hypothetical protein [Deltaproteobacteria bacterium]